MLTYGGGTFSILPPSLTTFFYSHYCQISTTLTNTHIPAAALYSTRASLSRRPPQGDIPAGVPAKHLATEAFLAERREYCACTHDTRTAKLVQQPTDQQDKANQPKLESVFCLFVF